MRKEVNPEVKPGDRVICIHMADDFSPIAGGIKGTVLNVREDDPFEKDQRIISVEWDNGRTLSLLSSEDIWIKEDDLKKENDSNLSESVQELITVNEQKGAPNIDTLVKIKDVFKYMKEKVFFDFLKKIRESGIVNMLDSSQFLMSGPEYLKKFIEMEEMKGREFDKEMVDKLLDLAEQTKNEIIQATFKIMEDNGIEDYSTQNINKIARKLSKDALTYYIIMFF